MGEADQIVIRELMRQLSEAEAERDALREALRRVRSELDDLSGDYWPLIPIVKRLAAALGASEAPQDDEPCVTCRACSVVAPFSEATGWYFSDFDTGWRCPDHHPDFDGASEAPTEGQR